MGLLSGITDTLFGDDGKEAVRLSREEAAQNRQFIREGQAQALDYIGGAFPQAQAGRDAATLAAMGVYADTTPQAFDMFAGGNLGAQQVTAAAPMQIQNALLGLPVDYGFLQPRQQQADFSFLSQGLPQAQEVAPQPEMTPNDALAGINNSIPAGSDLNDYTQALDMSQYLNQYSRRQPPAIKKNYEQPMSGLDQVFSMYDRRS